MTGVTSPLQTPFNVLRQAPFFSGLSDAQLHAITLISRPEDWAQHSRIYNIGDAVKSLYVLLDGKVRFAIGVGGRNTSAGDVLERGQVFGWAALVPAAQGRIATASCVTDCRVLAIDGARLLMLMDVDHTMGYRIMKQLNLLITGTFTSFAAG
ncbi:MAG: cyclic nucleotide-binding domain-containing protein [Methyloversatilis sp.]|jgi:toluene monooxygenase system ferredoxin subunit|nr:cyclic nucleotide-binding domain-containing protein [Methyloversatilis sp.]